VSYNIISKSNISKTKTVTNVLLILVLNAKVQLVQIGKVKGEQEDGQISCL
jgi:hypothetical protein